MMLSFWHRNPNDARNSYNPPIVLSPSIPFGLGIVLIMIAVAYEVLFAVVTHKGGLGPVNENLGIGHWAWSLPPVAIATALTLSVASLHFTSQRMEPLADLAAGHSAPNKSLHLDYLSMALPFTFWNALINRHRTVAYTAWMALLSISLSSLSSTIFVINTVPMSISIRLVQTTEFGIIDSLSDLTDFAASAASTYAFFAGDGSFPKYTSKYFALPAFNRTGGPYVSASAPVTLEAQAIRSLANCEFATIISKIHHNDAATTFVASGAGLPNGCMYNFTATPQLTYDTDTVTCSSFPNATVAPVAIWLGIDLSTGSTNATVHPINSTVALSDVSIVVCSPTISVATVNVTLSSDSMISNDSIQALGQDSTFQPTGGLALNGQYQLDVRAQQRLQNIHFQLTDAIYSAVISAGVVANSSDIQQNLLDVMSEIYQTYLSMFASRVYLVPTNNGSTFIGLSSVSLPFLFVSTPSVHILAGLLASLAIFSLLVAYQLHRKHNQDGFARRIAAIAGSPFTLAGAMSMSAGQSWAKEATASTGGAGSGSFNSHIDEEKTLSSIAPTKQKMMQRLAAHTYALDWSGKIVRDS